MSRSEEIFEILREELVSGKYTAGTRFPSEQKLMHRFGVSRITINKVTSLLVSDGYILRGRKGAGTLVADSSPFPLGTFAYAGPIDNDYSIQIINALQYHAFQNGYALSIFSPGAELMQYCIDRIRSSRYLGLFVTGIGVLPADYKLPFPLVYLDNGLPKGSIPRHSVTCTNAQGAADMAKALLDKGHREILIFSSYTLIEFSRKERIRSFMETLTAGGVPHVENRFFHVKSPRRYSEAKRILEKALEQFSGTTAILTDSDHIAFFLLRILHDKGLNKQITVTGFGALSGNYGLHRIPSVDQHPEEIALQGFTRMLQLLKDPGLEPTEIRVKTELINPDCIPEVNKK